MPEPRTLPEDLVRQATYRRDKLAVFGDLVLPRTALLVMNMQNAWLAPDAPFRVGSPDLFEGLLDRIHGFARVLRRAGGQVVWFRTTVGEPGTPQYWSTYYDHFIEPVKRARALAALAPGSGMHALSPEVEAAPEDWVLDKHRFSAFTCNAYDLEQKLRGRGVDSVVVAGTATNICCESTIRDAMMRDFRTFMPHDLVAAPSEDGHRAGLRSVMQAFADVRGIGDLSLNRGDPLP